MPVQSNALSREQKVEVIRAEIDKLRDGTEGRFPDSVIHYIAEEVVGDAKSLEGAVGRVVSQALLQRKIITREFAFEVLRERFSVQPPGRRVGDLTPTQETKFRELYLRNYRLPEIAAKMNLTTDKLTGVAKSLNLPDQHTLRFATPGKAA